MKRAGEIRKFWALALWPPRNLAAEPPGNLASCPLRKLATWLCAPEGPLAGIWPPGVTTWPLGRLAASPRWSLATSPRERPTTCKALVHSHYLETGPPGHQRSGHVSLRLASGLATLPPSNEAHKQRTTWHPSTAGAFQNPSRENPARAWLLFVGQGALYVAHSASRCNVCRLALCPLPGPAGHQIGATFHIRRRHIRAHCCYLDVCMHGRRSMKAKNH